MAFSNLLLVVAASALGGAVATAVTALPAQTGVVHQASPISIPSAPDPYHSIPGRPPAPAPVRLLVPSLNIAAAVEALGVNQDFSLEAPAGVSAVGWYRLGAAPGMPGDAIISGHRGRPGDTPAVFNSLAGLKQGDPIEVQLADGSVAQFDVTRVFTTPVGELPTGFFATEGAARLTLVTCIGDYDGKNMTYRERLVVEATSRPDAAATAHKRT